jgi:hypothetical protein
MKLIAITEHALVVGDLSAGEDVFRMKGGGPGEKILRTIKTLKVTLSAACVSVQPAFNLYFTCTCRAPLFPACARPLKVLLSMFELSAAGTADAAMSVYCWLLDAATLPTVVAGGVRMLLRLSQLLPFLLREIIIPPVWFSPVHFALDVLNGADSDCKMVCDCRSMLWCKLIKWTGLGILRHSRGNGRSCLGRWISRSLSQSVSIESPMSDSLGRTVLLPTIWWCSCVPTYGSCCALLSMITLIPHVRVQQLCMLYAHKFAESAPARMQLYILYEQNLTDSAPVLMHYFYYMTRISLIMHLRSCSYVCYMTRISLILHLRVCNSNPGRKLTVSRWPSFCLGGRCCQNQAYKETERLPIMMAGDSRSDGNVHCVLARCIRSCQPTMDHTAAPARASAAIDMMVS